jgi:AcrR family transcriptional regulator
MRAALELFEENGYDATPAAAIAERVGVTEMTFFRYFRSKDSVLLADPYDPLIADAVRRQSADLSPLVAAISGVADAWRSAPVPQSAAIRRRLRIVAQTPSLRGAVARSTAASEDAIAAALRARGVAEVAARIAAAATIGALSAALLEWAAGEDPDLGNAVDAAVQVLAGDRG